MNNFDNEIKFQVPNLTLQVQEQTTLNSQLVTRSIIDVNNSQFSTLQELNLQKITR